jgi:hypothetical protein
VLLNVFWGSVEKLWKCVKIVKVVMPIVAS